MKIHSRRPRYLGTQFKSISWKDTDIFTFISYDKYKQQYQLKVNTNEKSEWWYDETDITDHFENGKWVKI